MAQITVKDALSVNQTAALVVNTGTAANADSLPIAISTEGTAQIGIVTETAPASDTASSGLNGRLQRVAQRLTSLLAAVPPTYTEDAVADANPIGTASILIRKDALASEVSTDGDNVAHRGTSKGEAYTKDTDLYTLLNTSNAQLPAALGPATSANSLTVTMATDAYVALTSVGYESRISVTRPANVTAYAANDVVGGVITFTTIGPSAGQIMLNWADLLYQVANVPAGMTTMRLYLYNATPTSAYADNSPWDLTSADYATYLGYIDLGTPVDVGSSLICQTSSLVMQTKLAAASTSLFGYMVTTAGYTPAANSEVFRITLRSAYL